MRSLLVLAFALGGCSVASMTTAPYTRIGYAAPPKVAVRITGAGDIGEQWSRAFRSTSAAQLVDLAVEPMHAKGDSAHARMCQVGRELAQQGKAVDLVIEVETDFGSGAEDKCTDYRTTGMFSKNEETLCAKSVYDYSTAYASSEIRVLDAATCAPLRTVSLAKVAASASGSGPEHDRQEAERRALQRHDARVLATLVQDVVPRGVEVTSVTGRTAEVRDGGSDKLAAGEVYVVRRKGHTDDSSASDRVRVDAVGDNVATLETEAPNVELDVGDELRERDEGLRTSVYLAPMAGVVRASQGNAGYASLGLGARVSLEDAPLLFETEVTAGALPHYDATSVGIHGAVGYRRSGGRIHPLAFGELGYVQWRKVRKNGMLEDELATKGGSYAGLGVGVELRVRQMFVLADVRYRTALSASTTWESESSSNAAVDKTFEETGMLLVHAAAGYRF